MPHLGDRSAEVHRGVPGYDRSRPVEALALDGMDEALDVAFKLALLGGRRIGSDAGRRDIGMMQRTDWLIPMMTDFLIRKLEAESEKDISVSGPTPGGGVPRAGADRRDLDLCDVTSGVPDAAREANPRSTRARRVS